MPGETPSAPVTCESIRPPAKGPVQPRVLLPPPGPQAPNAAVTLGGVPLLYLTVPYPELGRCERVPWGLQFPDLASLFLPEVSVTISCSILFLSVVRGIAFAKLCLCRGGAHYNPVHKARVSPALSFLFLIKFKKKAKRLGLLTLLSKSCDSRHSALKIPAKARGVRGARTLPERARARSPGARAPEGGPRIRSPLPRSPRWSGGPARRRPGTGIRC